jgi:hypothetical protein
MSAYDSYLYSLMESALERQDNGYYPEGNTKMQSQSLYEISNNYENILFMLDSLEDSPEMAESLAEALEITSVEFEAKATAYCQIIRQEEASLDAIDNEIKRLQGLKKSRENKIKLLKDRLASAMNIFGKDKADLGIFKLSFRKSEALQVSDNLDYETIPGIYKKITVALDKLALKKAVKEGLEIEGVSIIENKNLQVK